MFFKNFSLVTMKRTVIHPNRKFERELPRLLSMEPIADDVLLRTLDSESKRCR